MKNCICKKLDLIQQLFTPERLTKSKQRWECIWKGVLPQDRLPFVYYPRYFNYYNDFNFPQERDKRLELMLDECILHGRLNDDFIPALFPGCRHSTIPSMFNVDEKSIGQEITCERIIQTVEDIHNLPEPHIISSSVASEWLETQRYWLEQTSSRIPIHVTDMQGPFDVCAQMMGYDQLFIAALSEPEVINRFFKIVSDAFILFWQEQKELLGDLFIPTHLFGWSWMPSQLGATLSADSMVMVSPDFFEEFYLPILNRISAKLGGLTVHSCGNFGHILSRLQMVQNLRGINAGQMSLQQLQQSGLRNNIVVIIIVQEGEPLAAVIDHIKAFSQPVDLTLHLYPEELLSKPVEVWSDSDWTLLYRREEALLKLLATN